LVYQCSADCGSWIPIDPKTIPVAKSGDTVVVTTLIAALLECEYDNALTYLNGYHSGIGLFNSQNNMMITVNFDAVPTFMGAIIPQLVYQPSGEVDLEWSDYGNVFIYAGMNMTFWSYGSEQVGTINGTVFNNLLNWFVAYNKTSPYYDPWSVHTQFPLQPWDRTWIPSHDCFAFLWETYQYLSTQGVFLTVKSGKQSKMALLTPTAPILLDMSNPMERVLVVSFYQYFIFQLDHYGISAILTILGELLYQEKMIIRYNGKYYMIQPGWPFFDTYYVSIPYPPYN
jgi:hypothetical protein